MADIGSDHAYLPCYAVLNHKASKAIAGEITDGPFCLPSGRLKNQA
ncbi:tRNA (adenine(22)-N(1))-methyltransferase [Bacillus subtilis]|nr:tRNA (adenine(22)-N(1))-methyltransferase [Bacillus subtilis]